MLLSALAFCALMQGPSERVAKIPASDRLAIEVVCLRRLLSEVPAPKVAYLARVADEKTLNPQLIREVGATKRPLKSWNSTSDEETKNGDSVSLVVELGDRIDSNHVVALLSYYPPSTERSWYSLLEKVKGTWRFSQVPFSETASIAIRKAALRVELAQWSGYDSSPIFVGIDASRAFHRFGATPVDASDTLISYVKSWKIKAYPYSQRYIPDKMPAKPGEFREMLFSYTHRIDSRRGYFVLQVTRYNPNADPMVGLWFTRTCFFLATKHGKTWKLDLLNEILDPAE